MTLPARSLVNPPPHDEPLDRSVPGAVPLAAFPAELEFALTTTDDLEDDVKIDRASDGTGRARVFWPQPKHAISTSLLGLTPDEWAGFDSFYRNTRAYPFTIPWGPCDSPVDLPVVFASPPKRTFHGNGLSSVTFTLVEFP